MQVAGISKSTLIHARNRAEAAQDTWTITQAYRPFVSLSTHSTEYQKFEDKTIPYNNLKVIDILVTFKYDKIRERGSGNDEG